MGVRRHNLTIFCDYATPERHTALELHMELPIPYQDSGTVQGWLNEKNWKASEDYFVGKYPQHRKLITEWLYACRLRSEERLEEVYLAA